MKRFKLSIHPKRFNEQELLINSKDFSTINMGDILEISSQEVENCRLLLQVTSSGDKIQKGCISIDQSVANYFHLKQYAEVTVKIIDDIKDVALDSVELTFKDQYLARSDMWRLKTCLINTCLYPSQKLEFCGIRCQILEMYIHGEKVTSGIVTEDTKIVYRSASSMVYLFIQMSCEMWEFDINGDLYFEKAINGFLPDLFSKWKKLNCNHDVTIVLFSRTFYKATSSDEFPLYMRECLQQDYKGRFYEDFYRVAVQNERYEDWTSTIRLLKKLFNQYQDIVLKYHERPGEKIPSAVNSTSSQGNFLEVLNMSLNVFEKHYMDRSFDRTGQLSVVITPGVGFFEVDRELTIITKQRIIDNVYFFLIGIGSDLVCLGEQPLHAVPLFKFYNKQLPQNAPTVVDDYNMPHWINLSFYSSPKQSIYTNFIPRIKLPTLRAEDLLDKDDEYTHSKRSRHASQPDPSFPVLFDYDEYDRQVFKVSAHCQNIRQTLSLQRPNKRKETLPHVSDISNTSGRNSDESRLTSSDPTPTPPYSHASSAAIAIPKRSIRANITTNSYQNSMENENSSVNRINRKFYPKDDIESEISPPYRSIVGSDPSYESQFNRKNLTQRLKPLVNPFNPSEISIKLTSNRRRWTHVFPLGPTGIFMQQHHYQAIPQISFATLVSLESAFVNPDNFLQRNTIFNSYFDVGTDYKSNVFGKRETHSASSYSGADGRSTTPSGRISLSGPPTDANLSFLWGATGEQEWTPAITTGVDWKSLVIPACLPITTDYFPDRRSLQNDYVLSDYSLLPEDIIAENAQPRYFQNDDDNPRRNLTTPEVYKELICQRLQQGFQIIIISKQHSSFPVPQVSSSPQYTPGSCKLMYAGQQKSEQEEYLLSIGRIFHKLNIDGPKITITQYRPRHSYREIKVHYCYRFHAPDSDTYGVSWVDFTSEKLENYNWNHLDHYICMRGEGEFNLKESLKYWRLRMLLLPAGQPETKKIIEGNLETCDLYKEFKTEEKLQQREGVLKFFESMNKIKRSSNNKWKPLLPRRSSAGQTGIMLSGSSFRDRANSNRIADRPRMRSNSAKMGARPEQINLTGRISPATEVNGKYVIPKSDSALDSMGESAEENLSNEDKKLKANSTDAEIIQAMKNPNDGLNFLSKTRWPSTTFISAEAVAWIMEQMEGILVEQQAINVLQTLVDKNLICHASGVKDHPFIHGFYLYYICSPNDKKTLWDKEELDTKEVLSFFEGEWLEVELSPVTPSEYITEDCKFTFEKDIWNPCSEPESDLKFKCCNIQIDQGTKTDRQEWGQLRYQSIYRPYEAFELVMEWMVATGNKTADLVQCWARKSNQFGLQLVPIPSDPFALPFSDDSDPLRGPIFIPLDLSCLNSISLQSMDDKGLLKLQEKILCRFGFIPYRNPNSSLEPQYVHISGSMFVMLPVNPKENKPLNKEHLSYTDLHQISSPHDEYITRHFSGVIDKRRSSLNSEADTKVGFLWSWNYMITKRWKNAGTVDENFMRKVMRDFKAFCSNHNGRLEEFWNSTINLELSQDHLLLMDIE